VSWLKDDSVTDHADLPEPEEIAAEIVAQLETALGEMRALQGELGDTA
jgi:type I restriction enzyme M protein